MIANNLFTGIANRFLTIIGFYNVTFNHNTHFQNGNVTAFTGEPSIGFVYTNNITAVQVSVFLVTGREKDRQALDDLHARSRVSKEPDCRCAIVRSIR